jgi:hypothetical protein
VSAVVGGLFACAHAETPAPATRAVVDARLDWELHTGASSSGPPVLIINELGFAPGLTRPLAERLLRRGHTVALASATPQVESLESFAEAVAAASADRTGWRVLALGVGGTTARRLAERPGAIRGVVAVNVPERLRIGNVALADALAEGLFQPERWLHGAQGQLLLGAGRSTPDGDTAVLRGFARPLSVTLAADIARRFVGEDSFPSASVPTVRFVSVKDNLVSPEDVLLPTAAGEARRLGRLELFARDYGHLDWLISDEAISDTFAPIADALEAL